MSLGGVLVCAAIGPALSSTHLLHFERVTDLTINQQKIEIISLDHNSSVNKYSFKTLEYRTMDCPGTVLAESPQGDLAYLKGMATTLTGEYQGWLVYSTPQGELLKAPIKCISSPHPQCKNHQDEIGSWEEL